MMASETDKNWGVGYVSGSFDMFHIGHLNLLRRAKERCGRLIAGVMTDEAIMDRKKKWPVAPLAERMEIVAALKCVDETDATTFELLDKIAAWKKYRFDVMFSGDDHAYDGWTAEEAGLKELGAELAFFPYTAGVSSTIRRGEVLPPKAGQASKPEALEGGFKFLFPFDKVEKGERIVIYGAGDVGRQYARQLAAVNFCKAAAFADTYAREGETAEGLRCLTPGELSRHGTEYDRVVVASSRYHAQIVERLRALGIPPERIV